MVESLLIGLSTSASCVAQCGNIILSIIMAEKKSVGQSYGLLGGFMLGRLLIYSGISAVISLIDSAATIPASVTAVSLIAVSAIMLIYSVGKTKQLCVGHHFTRKIYSACHGRISLLAFAAGALSSLNICPPIISLIASSIGTKAVFANFAMFFIGTSVFFLPMPLIGAIKNTEAVTKTGRAAALIVSIIFLAKGIGILASGQM